MSPPRAACYYLVSSSRHARTHTRPWGSFIHSQPVTPVDSPSQEVVSFYLRVLLCLNHTKLSPHISLRGRCASSSPRDAPPGALSLSRPFLAQAPATRGEAGILPLPPLCGGRHPSQCPGWFHRGEILQAAWLWVPGHGFQVADLARRSFPRGAPEIER